MEENALDKQIIKRQKTFPWLKTFLDDLRKNFPDCKQDLMQYLLENLNNEVKTVSVNLNRKRMKILFETLQDLFLHFWWRMRYENEKKWKKYWKKGCTGYYNNDLRSKYLVKLLYFIIYVGIQLSKGAVDSPWINRILRAVNALPDCDNIIYSSLLLVENLKKKYRYSYYEILKNVLIRKATKCISEPLVYMKIMLLFRRLKANLKHTDEKKEFLSTLSKFHAPYNLIPWMTSFDLDVSQLKKNNISQLLFKSSFNDLFKKLQPIVAENEFLPSREESKGNKNNATNLKSSFDLDSTFNFFHSSGDLEVEEKGSIKTPAKNKKKSEEQESRIAVSLDETNSVAFHNGEDDDETSNLDVTPSSPTTINKTSMHLDDVNSCNKSISLPQLCTGDHQMPASPVTDETNIESNKVKDKMEKRKNKCKKDKTSKTERKISTTKNKKKSEEGSKKRKMKSEKESKKRKRKSEKEESRIAVSLDKTHSISFDNGEDVNETVNLGVTPSSPSIINKNAINLYDINSWSKSVNLSLQLSSPKGDTLLFNSATQSSTGDHLTPSSPKMIEINAKDNEIVDKMKKTKGSSEKEETSKTDAKVSAKKIGCKYERKREKNISKKEEWELAKNLDEAHSEALNNRVDDDETADLGLIPSSLVTINNTAVNLDGISLSNESVDSSLLLSSPKRDTLLLNSVRQLNAGDHQVPSSPTNNENNTKNIEIVEKIKKRKKLNLSKAKTGRKKIKMFNQDAVLSATNPIEVPSNKEELCNTSESPLNISANENAVQNGDHQRPFLPQKNKINTKSNKIGEKIKKKKSLNLTKKEKTGNKKMKLFNCDTFESTTKTIKVHSNKEVLYNASESPVNVSTNENTVHNVNTLHNSPKGKVLLTDKNVLDKLSRVCEKSCSKVIEDMVAKEKVYSHVEDDVIYNTQSAPLFDSMPDLSTEDNVTYNTQSPPLFNSMPDLSTEDNVTYNTLSAPLFDSIPDLSTDQNNSTLHPNSNPSFSGNPILYKESSTSKDTCEGNRNEVNSVYNETVDHVQSYVGSQTPIHLQHVNVINPESQTNTGANNLDCDSAKLESFSSENNSQIFEQLCSSFNSLTNMDSNSNSDSFAQNAVREIESRNSVNENAEFSASQNLNQTGNSTVEVSANGFVIPSNRVLSSNTDPDGNTSLVIDCSFVNNATNPQQSECRLNSDVASIKLVINLNKKQGDNMQLQQPNNCCAGNFKLNAMPLCGNTASNTCTNSINLSQRTSFPITSSSPVIPPQCGVSSCSRCGINNSHQKTSAQPQLEVRVPQNLTSSTPYQRHKKTSAPKTSNNPCNTANYFASPLQCVPSTSQRRTPADDLEFYSPHMSGCESNGPAVDVHWRSSTTPSSLQKKFIETNVESASNLMQRNITPAISRLKHDHILHSSRNSSRQLQPFHNLSKKSSVSNKSHRNSTNDIYSDVSCDDISVSSMGIISDEETDHSFMKGLSRSSSESPLKKRSCGSNNNFRARTISSSSIECHSTPESIFRRSKKVSFSNLNYDNSERSEQTTNTTKTTRTYTKRHKKNPVKSCYKLRNRRKICKPSNLYDYQLNSEYI